MKQHEFELRVMKLWTTTRVPMTRANLIAYTHAERAKMEPWLDELVKAGLLEVDSDDEGEIVWKVRGASRPARGPTRVGEPAEGSAGGSAVARRAVAPAAIEKREKSVLASTILSFVFGPLGWLYAAPMKEAIPAAIVTLLISAIFPRFMLVYIFGVLSPLSAIAGLLYAWTYNRNGRRMPLIAKEDPPALGRGR